MKVGVIGLWHLGCVTATCLAKWGHDVVAYDENVASINDLRRNQLPVYEPHLEELLQEGKKNHRLHFTNHANELTDCEIIWVTYDVPVNSAGEADITNIHNRLFSLFTYFKASAIIIISSQLPVGSTYHLTSCFKEINPNKAFYLVYSPENLRLGNAVNIFLNPDRIVMGSDTLSAVKTKIEQLLFPLTKKILWMSIKAAEMTKHAINSFLATSIGFINELATLCQMLEVDIKAVEKGLKSDIRIGPLAYLSAGPGFSGSTLVRDVKYLLALAENQKIEMPLLKALFIGNNHHNQWNQTKLKEIFPSLKGKHIAILGLAYKPGTNVLRNSAAIKLSQWLYLQGVKIKGYDPFVRSLTPELEEMIQLQLKLSNTLKKVHAIVISSACTAFSDTDSTLLTNMLSATHILDIGGVLKKYIKKKTVNYHTIA